MTYILWLNTRNMLYIQYVFTHMYIQYVWIHHFCTCTDRWWHHGLNILLCPVHFYWQIVADTFTAVTLFFLVFITRGLSGPGQFSFSFLSVKCHFFMALWQISVVLFPDQYRTKHRWKDQERGLCWCHIISPLLDAGHWSTVHDSSVIT